MARRLTLDDLDRMRGEIVDRVRKAGGPESEMVVLLVQEIWTVASGALIELEETDKASGLEHVHGLAAVLWESSIRLSESRHPNGQAWELTLRTRESEHPKLTARASTLAGARANLEARLRILVAERWAAAAAVLSPADMANVSRESDK